MECLGNRGIFFFPVEGFIYTILYSLYGGFVRNITRVCVVRPSWDLNGFDNRKRAF